MHQSHVVRTLDLQASMGRDVDELRTPHFPGEADLELVGLYRRVEEDALPASLALVECPRSKVVESDCVPRSCG